jgi:hypothetical protein
MITSIQESTKKKTKSNQKLLSQLSCTTCSQRDALIFEYLEACKIFNLLLYTLIIMFEKQRSINDVISLLLDART